MARWDPLTTNLMAALDDGSLMQPISEQVDGFELEDGYALGAELVRLRRQRGERTIGRKLGFTNQALWELLGVDAPFWSYVYDTSVSFWDSGVGDVSLADVAQPRLEPELVLHFAVGPPEGADAIDLVGCIDWIAPAFEIVQCHFSNWEFRTPDAIADFGVHGALAVGSPLLLSRLDDPLQRLAEFTIVLTRDGVEVARGGGNRVMGSPVRALSYVMQRAGDQAGWEPIRAGDIVTTGTLTGLHVVEPGERWEIAAAVVPFEPFSVRIS